MCEVNNTFLVIDSHALIYRAYYAFPQSLVTSEGEVVNAVFGFTSLLLDVLIKFKPSNVVAVFDSAGPTQRHTEYTQYKANRSKADELFVNQLPRIQEVLNYLNIPILQINGFEADDLVGTVINKGEEYIKQNLINQNIIVTGDRDLLQLVDDKTFVYLAGSTFSQSKLFDALMVKEKMGVDPLLVPDLKGLYGDASDNIPGVKGIGEKGALDLITKFGTVKEIYENIEKVDTKYKQKLIDGYDDAILSHRLATINRDVPISFDLNSTLLKKINVDDTKRLFNSLQFKSLLKKLDSFLQIYNKEKELTIFNQNILPEKKSIPVKQWDIFDKKSIKEGDEITLISKFNVKDEGILSWRVEEIYFQIKGSEEVFKIDKKEDLFNFFDLISICKNVTTFDKKRLFHSLVNLDNKLVRLKNYEVFFKRIIDIGIGSVLLGEGRVKFEMKSIFHFWNKEYSADLVENLKPLSEIGQEILVSEDFPNKKVLIELENAILSTIIDMELSGITLDVGVVTKSNEILNERLHFLETEIYKDAGHEFNIASPKQLAYILFHEKSLPINKKTKGGGESTDEATLRHLIMLDPIIQNILNYREIDKLISTYVVPLPKYVDSFNKIHSVFDQFGAVSGRFSSKYPNMQNIPAEEVFGVNMRDAFISSKDSIFVSFDYSQQELRILAALSQEKQMIDSFNNDLDIHKLTASEIFNKSIDEITPAERDVGKTINFSVIYGISGYGLSERMGIDRKTAEDFIKKYFNKYKAIEAFLNKVITDAKKDGFSSTMLGRRRINEMIYSNNRNLRSGAERELFNFTIQGSAADIMKVALSEFNKIVTKYSANLLLQIHDEYLFEFTHEGYGQDINKFLEDSEFKLFCNEIYSTMINVYDIGVSYKVHKKVGFKWGELKEI